MRILFLTSAFPPESEGAATHLPELAESLQLAGHRTRVLAVVNRHEIKDSYPFRVRRISRSQFSPVRELRVLWNMVNDARQSDAIYTYGIWWQAAVASAFTGKPWVVRFVGDKIWEENVESGRTKEDISNWNEAPKSLMTAIRHGLYKMWGRLATKHIVSCDTLSHILLDWGLNREKIDVIPNALPKNPKEDEEATYLAQWNNKEGLRLIAVGNVTKAKNLEVVLEALEKKESAHLVIAGDGPHLENIKALTLEKKLSDRVLFTGKVSRQDITGYVNECQVLVLSSLLGKFNYSLLEALNQKKAVFASNCGLHPDLIDNGDNGWLFSSNDPNELVDLMESYEHSELQVKPASSDSPTWEQYVEQSVDILESLSKQ